MEPTKERILRENQETCYRGAQPGDIIAVAGQGRISQVIRRFTGAGSKGISHVAMVIQAARDGSRIMESTTMSKDGRKGVQVRRFNEILDQPAISVMWCPLRSAVFQAARISEARKYLERHHGKRYGYTQAILAGLGIPQPNFDHRLFCSELIAGAYKAANILPPWVAQAQTDPVELLQFNLYNQPLWVGGEEPVEIPGYSSKNAWEVLT